MATINFVLHMAFVSRDCPLDHLFLLKCSLYNLKQASFPWVEHMFGSTSWIQAKNDNSLFVICNLVYPSPRAYYKALVVTHLSLEFEMADQNPLHQFLAVTVIKITQLISFIRNNVYVKFELVPCPANIFVSLWVDCHLWQTSTLCWLPGKAQVGVRNNLVRYKSFNKFKT